MCGDRSAIPLPLPVESRRLLQTRSRSAPPRRPQPPALSPARCGRVEKDASVQPGDSVPAAERERAVDLAPEQLEHVEDAVLAGAGDAPEMRAPDQHRARAERQRLDDIDAAPEAAVDQHRRLALDRLDHSRQRADRGDRAVELAPAMVGDDDPVGAALRASRASSGCRSPLRISGPRHRFRSQSTSRQPMSGSSCSDHQRPEGGERRAARRNWRRSARASRAFA